MGRFFKSEEISFENVFIVGSKTSIVVNDDSLFGSYEVI